MVSMSPDHQAGSGVVKIENSILTASYLLQWSEMMRQCSMRKKTIASYVMVVDLALNQAAKPWIPIVRSSLVPFCGGLFPKKVYTGDASATLYVYTRWLATPHDSF